MKHPCRRATCTLSAIALAVCVVLVVPASGLECIGDCDGDRRVMVHELLQGIDFALGWPGPRIGTCKAAFDTGGDGLVDVYELIVSMGCERTALSI